MRTFPSRHAKRRRPHVAGGSPVWLFDLDNTLHHASHSIFPAINRGMTQYIIDSLQVEREEADRLRRVYTDRYGATLLGLARHHPEHPASLVALRAAAVLGADRAWTGGARHQTR